MRRRRDTARDIWRNTRAGAAIALAIAAYSLFAGAREEWPDTPPFTFRPVAWVLDFAPWWILALAASAVLLLVVFEWGHRTVGALEGGPQLGARGYVVYTHVVDLDNSARSFRRAAVVRVRNESAGHRAGAAADVVPWLSFANEGGSRSHDRELQGRWMAVDPATDTDLVAGRLIPREAPTLLEKVDLGPDGIPFQVIVVEEHLLPLAFRAVIPLGDGMHQIVQPDVPLLVRVRLAGVGVPLNSVWWFRIELQSSAMDEGPEPHLTIEQMKPPQASTDAPRGLLQRLMALR